MNDPTLKKTPLHDIHRKLGARMVPFGGWDMPVDYGSILKEHTAVREKAGLFDVCHMGEIEVKGKRALEFAQKISTNDLSRLKPGKVIYSAILNEAGGLIDDCTVYATSEDHYLFVVNASHTQEVMAWFEKQKASYEKDVVITDKSAEFALLALQGPQAQTILEQCLGRNLDTLQYYEFILGQIQGIAVMISRTGYTGEDGFEIYFATDKAVLLWSILLTTGKPQGICPIGLGARDTLRLEMGYLLSGQDFDATTNPLEVGLGWIVKFDKGHFIGKKALEAIKQQGLKTKMVGLKLLDKSIPRNGYEVWAQKKRVGRITSGTFSPSLKVGVALAQIDSTITGEVLVRVRDQKYAPALVVKPPFVRSQVKK